jgi:fructokinase
MIICCGEALIDMVPSKDPSGADVFIPCKGGSPYYTAIAAGRLLAPPPNGKKRVGFLTRLSRDFFGQALVDNLEANNVSTDLIIRSEENTTLAFVKLENGAEPQYIFYTEGAADRSLVPGDVPPEFPPETDCLVFGSISLTMEPSASTIERCIARESARSDGPVISHDPNVRPMMIKDREAYVQRFEGWVRTSTMVKISSADFDFIYPGMGLEAAMKKLLDMGPCLVAATLGKDGAAALLKRRDPVSHDYEILRVDAPVVNLPVVDTIGAGDTFHGAFLAKLALEGKLSRAALPHISEGELQEALCFANKAASIVCSRKGANPPTLAEVQAL